MMVLLAVVVAVTFNGMKPVAESWEKAAAANQDAAAKMAAVLNKFIEKEEGVQSISQGTPNDNLPPPPPDV